MPKLEPTVSRTNTNKDIKSSKSNTNKGMLKPRTKAFVDLLDGNSKLSQTEAYIQTHTTNNRASGAVEASKLLRKPNVIIYRRKHAQMAVRNIVDLASDKRVHEATRLKANIDILDRFDGKPIQKVVTENTNLNINVEASKELGEDFTRFLKGKTQI